MKRFLAGILAIALVVTSLYYAPVEEVHAMTQSDWFAVEKEFGYVTKEPYQGLNFNNLQYNYYFAEETLDQLPATFEATIRLTTEPSRAGVILGNSKYEDSSTKEQGTFNFGLHLGLIPYLYVADANNKDGILYRFDKFGAILPEGEEDVYGNNDGLNNTKFQESYNIFRSKEWIHLAIVNDAKNKTMTCYVDGQQYCLATSSDGSTYYDAANWVMSKAMALGSDYRNGNTQQFIGDIKNVAIYTDARTTQEIQSDCAAMKVENANYVPVADENLMACYALDLDATTGLYPKTLKDLSTNSYDMVTYDWLTADDMKEKNLTISRDDYSYSMAVIGDPQCIASTKDRMETLFQWVKDNAEAKNIKFAFHMGDSVDTSIGDKADTYWKYSSNALKLLNRTVPYSIVRGNHDSIEKYNQYYSYAEYKDSISGSYDQNMLNTYQKFQVGDIKYLVLNLDFGVGASYATGDGSGEDTVTTDPTNDRRMTDGSGNPDKVLAWANEVVKANPDHNVILTTHGYTEADGTRLKQERTTTTSAPTCTKKGREGYYREYSGDDIYEKLVKDNSNIVLVLSGHIGTEYIKQRTVTRADGSNVVEMLVNPQTTDQWLDDCGLVAMMYFDEMNTETKKQDVTLQYYSTLRDRYYLTENQNIKITLDVIESDIIENEDGSVAISYDNVRIGEDTVTAPEDYQDYVFAGWYSNAGCTTAIKDKTKVNESSYALFKPSSILDVKIQITNAIVTGETSEDAMKYNDKYVIRFVSSVDCLDYKKVGFVVETKEGTYVGTSSSIKVFKGIESSNAGSEYNFSPKVISEKSQYLITAKLPISPEKMNEDYVVRAYWETLDGTIVYGNSRCVSVNDNNVLKADAEKDTINMVVSGELTGTGYTASFTSSSDNSVTTDDFKVTGAAVEVLNVGDGYSNVRITLPNHGDFSKMASLTKVTIDGTDYFGMYRNYYTSHKSGTASKPHADTSWYYASEDTSKFVIASSADLYGLANLVNGMIDLFEGDWITLIGDVEVNTGTSWQNAKATSISSAYAWIPIGNNLSSAIFSGNFDGDGNSISGLYTVNRASGGNYVNSNGYVGFFGRVSAQGSIKNVAVINSYFDNYKNYTGSIVGFSATSVYKNLFSDATLVGLNCTGGIVGRTTNAKVEMTGCWYDGEIDIVGTITGTTFVGGIVGQTMSDTDGESFTDCLFTGTIDCSAVTQASADIVAGGIFGGHQNDTQTSRRISFDSCAVVCDYVPDSSKKTTYFGEAVGYCKVIADVKSVNCYAMCTKTESEVTSATTSDYGYATSAAKALWDSEWTVSDKAAFQALIDSDGTWVNVEGMDIPVLAEFAHLWQKINNNN